MYTKTLQCRKKLPCSVVKSLTRSVWSILKSETSAELGAEWDLCQFPTSLPNFRFRNPTNVSYLSAGTSDVYLYLFMFDFRGLSVQMCAEIVNAQGNMSAYATLAGTRGMLRACVKPQAYGEWIEDGFLLYSCSPSPSNCTSVAMQSRPSQTSLESQP